MSLIIDDTFFTGKLNLPQTSNSPGLALVQEFIDTYEPEFMEKALGLDLWKAFSGGIDGSGEPTEQRWKDLLYGKEFAYNGRNFKWQGFQPPDSKRSPIANYVYFQFLENESNVTTGVGTTIPSTSNADRISPLHRMTSAWNEMADMLYLLWGFLYANKDTYPEWKEYQTPGVISWKWDWWIHCPKSDVYYKINEFNI